MISQSKNNKSSLFYRPAGTPVADNANLCNTSNPPQEVFSIDPITLDNDLGVKKFYTHNPSNIDSSRDQLWAVCEYRHYHKDIACGVGLLYSNPKNNFVRMP